MREIFRIENPVTKNGMWYDAEGKYAPFILELTDGVSAGLPMDFDERYGAGGVRWFSAAGDFEQLQYWFSRRDVDELAAAGFCLYRMEVKEFIEEEFQVLFTRRGVCTREQLDIGGLFS